MSHQTQAYQRTESVLDAPARNPRRRPAPADPIVAHNRSAVVSVIAALDTRADDPLVQHEHLMRAYSELDQLVRRNADRLTVRGLLEVA